MPSTKPLQQEKASIEGLLTAKAIGGFHVGVIAPSLRFHDMRVG